MIQHMIKSILLPLKTSLPRDNNLPTKSTPELLVESDPYSPLLNIPSVTSVMLLTMLDKFILAIENLCAWDSAAM